MGLHFEEAKSRRYIFCSPVINLFYLKNRDKYRGKYIMEKNERKSRYILYQTRQSSVIKNFEFLIYFLYFII